MTPDETQKATFPISDEVVRGAVVKTLLESMDTLTKEKLLQQAIEHILKFRPETRTYGYTPPTPLEEAFNSAVQRFAHEEVARVLKEDTRIKEAVARMVKEAWEKATAAGPSRDEMVNRLAVAIANGFVVKHERD